MTTQHTAWDIETYIADNAERLTAGTRVRIECCQGRVYLTVGGRDQLDDLRAAKRALGAELMERFSDRHFTHMRNRGHRIWGVWSSQGRTYLGHRAGIRLALTDEEQGHVLRGGVFRPGCPSFA